jgi:hypothetical protein
MEVSPLTAARAAEDLGIAALAGGNLFGRVALHHAVERLPRPEDRGLVVNAAWRRYGTVNSLSLAAVVGGWLATRNEKRDPALTMAKDVAVGAVAVTGIAAAAAGVRFGKAAPGGAVPLESGSEPARDASPSQTRQKRALNVLGALNLASELALAGIQSVAR